MHCAACCICVWQYTVPPTYFPGRLSLLPSMGPTLGTEYLTHISTAVNKMQSEMADSVPTPCKFEQTMLSDVCLVQDPQDVRRISNSEGLVTLTLDQVILHTIMHHSSTSTYMPNIKEIEKTFCEWTDGHTHGILETGSIRSTL